jgi:hypothetical protein
MRIDEKKIDFPGFAPWPRVSRLRPSFCKTILGGQLKTANVTAQTCLGSEANDSSCAFEVLDAGDQQIEVDCRNETLIPSQLAANDTPWGDMSVPPPLNTSENMCLVLPAVVRETFDQAGGSTCSRFARSCKYGLVA